MARATTDPIAVTAEPIDVHLQATLAGLRAKGFQFTAKTASDLRSQAILAIALMLHREHQAKLRAAEEAEAPANQAA